MPKVAITGIAFLLTLAASGQQSTQHVEFQKRKWPYQLFSPADRNHPAPAILLLHGAGGSGAEMIAAWVRFAAENGIVLIAPDLPRKPEFEDIAPAFFRAVVDSAARKSRIDSERRFVFGHSMGGYLAFDAAVFDADYFAAVAVHASYIAPEYTGILERATRRTPIALYIGDRDPLVAVANVRGTRDLLTARGFPLHYVELPGHDHDYWALSEKINADAWQFLERQRLHGALPKLQ